MENEIYELDAFCKNCDFNGKVTVPKGIVFSEAKCPKCGIKMLVKKLPPIRIIPHIEDYR